MPLLRADALLHMAAVTAERAASYARGIFFARRFACSRRKKVGRANATLCSIATRTQITYLNRETASMADFQVDVCRRKQASAGVGTGRWKQRTEYEFMRVAFAAPSQTLVHIARALKPQASSRHVADLQFAAGKYIVSAQGRAIDDRVAKASFCVLQVVFDSSQYRMLFHKEKNTRAIESELFALQGRLVIGNAAFEVEEDDIVIPPTALEENTASNMYGALKAMLPAACADLMFGHVPLHIRMVALNPGSDRFSANAMLVAHLEEASPDNVIILPGWCKQHDTGNCLAPVVSALNLINPSYCLAKRMRACKFNQRFEAGMKLELLDHLVHMKASEHPEWRPRESDSQLARQVLELAYFDRDIRKPGDAEGADDHAAGLLRRRVGEQLLRECLGNWKKKKVIFWDRASDARPEFTTREEAVEHTFGLLKSVAFHVLGDPALNKWLSVWPLLCRMVTMMSFHRLFLRAIRHACKVVEGEDDDLSDFSDGERLGAPSKDAWHKQERRRDLKTLAWVEEPTSNFHSMLFVHACSCVIRLHFKFFKDAQRSPFYGDKSLIFNLAGAESVARKVVAELWAILKGERWGPLEVMFGKFRMWPVKWQEQARQVALSLIGQLQHRLIDPFDESPYDTFVPIADPDNEQPVKLQFARLLFGASEATLHSSAIKVRKNAGSPEALLQPFWQAFLFQAVNKVVLSSACVEVLFAHYKQWMACSPKPMSLSLIQSKHANHEYKQACERKRKNEQEFEPLPTAKCAKYSKPCRKPWVLKMGDLGQRNSYHEVMGESIRNRCHGVTSRQAFADASKAYSAVCAGVKAKAKSRARLTNKKTVASKTDAMLRLNTDRDDVPSLWDIAEGSEYYLHPRTLATCLAQPAWTKNMADAWYEFGSRISPDVTFPTSVTYRKLQTLHALELSEANKVRAVELCKSLRVVLAPRGSKGDKWRQPLLLADVTTREGLMVQCIALWKSPTFDCEFVVYENRDDGLTWDRATLPCLAQLPAKSDPVTLQAIAIRFVTYHSNNCTLQRVDVKPAGSGDVTVIRLGETIDIEQEKERVLEHARCSRAFKLVKMAMLPWHKRPRPRAKKASAPRKAGEGAAVEADPIVCDALSEPESDDPFAAAGVWVVDPGAESDSDDDPTWKVGDVVPGGDAPPAAPPPLLPAAVPPLGLEEVHHLEKVDIKDVGFIKIDMKRRQFNAHCKWLGDPLGIDHRTPTMPECRMNRGGRFAPLALLVVWLEKGCDCWDHAAHIKLARDRTKITLDDRTRAREWLESQPALARLIELEALWCGVDRVVER